jgi:RNA polymerase sigma-70 factor (family 1)
LHRESLYNLQELKALQLRLPQNDEAAFTLIYQHLYKKLVQFSFSLVRSNELAEETVEDVFVKLWSKRATAAAIENLVVYLYVAVKNASLNAISQKANELVNAPFDFLETAAPVITTNPYDLMITGEMMAKMNAVIENLPPRCKLIFKLVREDGLKYKEVSEILNISVNTIDAQMAIAVKRICLALEVIKPLKTNGFSRLETEISQKVKKS